MRHETFCIVEDEPAVRTAYARLIEAAGMQPRTFASVEDFMRSDFSAENACVLADIRLPGIGGLNLPGLLACAGYELPVIFVTGDLAPETRERAQRAGAAAYFCKPVDDQALLDTIIWVTSARGAK